MNARIDEIRIESSHESAAELCQALRDALTDTNENIRIELRPARSKTRSPLGDSAVLVAVLSGGAAALSTLINGLLKILENRQSKSEKIVLKGSSGATIEVPAGTPSSDVNRLVELAKELDRPQIRLQS